MWLVGNRWSCRPPLVTAGHQLLGDRRSWTNQRTPGPGWPTVANHWLERGWLPPLLCGSPFLVPYLPPPSYFLLPNFLHMWSTLLHWLQHMPALPRLPLKFSNTHNFWSIGKEKYEIYTPAKLIARCMFTKSFKKSEKNLRLSDATQYWFVRCTDIQSFRG
jgi:hypothetical protein